MTDLNLDGDSHAHSLVAAGKVDRDSGWSFSSSDGNALLGPKGEDWGNYSKFHLGIDRAAKPNTKGRYKYPFGKGGKVYRSGVIAAKQRAAQQGESAIENAADSILQAIDKNKSIEAKEDIAEAIQDLLDDAAEVIADTLYAEADAATEEDEEMVEEISVTSGAGPGESITPARSFVTMEELRSAMCSEQGAAPGMAVRTSFDTKVKAVEGQRALNFTISTPNVDRMGDTIAVDGWKLDSFRKNPVVLWAHDSSQPPVAKAVRLAAEDGALKSTALFVSADVPGGIGAFAEGVYQLYKQGFLNATSVGFAPIEYSLSQDPERGLGIDFKKQELLEFSCVPIPANAEALIEGRSVISSKSYHSILDWIEASLRTNKERAVKFAESILGSDGTDIFLREHAIRVLAVTDEYLSPAIKRELGDLRRWKAEERRKIAVDKARKKRQRELEIIKLRGEPGPKD